MQAECQKRKFSSTVAYMKCVNNADAIVVPHLTPQLANVWQLRMDRKMVLAEQVDRKEVKSGSEMLVKLREINDQAMGDMTRILKN